MSRIRRSTVTVKHFQFPSSMAFKQLDFVYAMQLQFLKSKKMVKKEEASGSRKSARLCALDEKSRILSVQKLTKASSSSPPAAAAAARRRGRKRKSLQAVVTHSVTASPPQVFSFPCIIFVALFSC